MEFVTRLALTTGKLIILIIILQLQLTNAALNKDESGINQVHLIFRNEFSVPSETYPKDPNRYIEQVWGLPPGELTDDGKSSMLKLGQEIRKQKYPHFPKSDTFSLDDVYVRSIDTNRNILSAQMLLGGFCDAVTDLKRTVPIHSAPLTQDTLLSDFECPYYDQLLAEQHSSASALLSEDGFLDQLSDYTGFPVQSFDDIISLHAILEAQQKGNQTMELKRKEKAQDKKQKVIQILIPTWLKESTRMNNRSMTFWERIQYTTGIAHSLAAKTVNMQRFHGGPLLTSIAAHFNDYLLRVKTKPMLYFYSVESITLATILAALESFNNTVPDYGETVAIELHKIGGQRIVKVLKIKPTGNGIQIKPVDIPHCGKTCSLSKFQDFVDAFTITELEKECQLPLFHCIFCNKGVIIVITCLSVVIVILVAILILIAVISQYRKKREESNKRMEAQYHFHEKGQPWTTFNTLRNNN